MRGFLLADTVPEGLSAILNFTFPYHHFLAVVTILAILSILLWGSE